MSLRGVTTVTTPSPVPYGTREAIYYIEIAAPTARNDNVCNFCFNICLYL